MSALDARLTLLSQAVGADIKTINTALASNTKAISGGPTLQLGYLRLAVGASVPTGTPAGTLIVRG